MALPSTSLEEQKRRAETKSEAESLLPLFRITRILNHDQNGRRITLLGSIKDQPGLLTFERAAFESDLGAATLLLQSLSDTINLGANDIYRWYMSNTQATPARHSLKINLIWPCTDAHIKKYTAQQLRYVIETPEVYAQHIRPWIERTQRTPKRLDWIYNILDGVTEQEDVVHRSSDFGISLSHDKQKSDSEGFLLLPDLNWDRRTATGLHLLALVERRDLYSLRSLKQKHVPWLKHLRNEIVKAASGVASKLAGELVDEDQIKCYIHYQPTYYHFHVHVVHVMLEANGTTQAVGKAFALENIISQLENMAIGESVGMDNVDLGYFMGEESPLWKSCFGKIKTGEKVDLNDE
ncbi:hypothetical protein LTR05_004890 [Lithohypha guttulata]|uniref:Scavenger mRNA decapping enzyme n=1 Tax=Lithohypha guttulata TaxID=1690604 RepID=A0AAN7T0A0_9EURO|nr:hypothetical protein LTR05_004890 [Lithohypha guttulata]